MKKVAEKEEKTNSKSHRLHSTTSSSSPSSPSRYFLSRFPSFFFNIQILLSFDPHFIILRMMFVPFFLVFEEIRVLNLLVVAETILFLLIAVCVA